MPLPPPPPVGPADGGALAAAADWWVGLLGYDLHGVWAHHGSGQVSHTEHKTARRSTGTAAAATTHVHGAGLTHWRG